MEEINGKTGMTHAEARQFVRDHFEALINQRNLVSGRANLAADFVDHGADAPPGLPPGPVGAIDYVSAAHKRFPDLHVEIEDMIAEDDKVVVRNLWTGTEAESGRKLEIRGIVIWRIAGRKLAERWAYIGTPRQT
jgi:predicted ester cyclase